MNRGDIYDVDWPDAGRHPVVIVTRQVAIPVLTNVTVASVTTTVRGVRTELPLGEAHGLDRESVANCDNLLTVPKSSLANHRGSLSLTDVAKLNDSLRVALELDV